MTKPRTGSIYPEKSRQGVYTGRWVRETTVDGGRRLRTRHATLQAAQGHTEAIPGPLEFTLGDLYAKSEALLWKGTRDELQSGRRFKACVDILGLQTPLARIRKPELEALARKLSEGGRGAKTINRYLACLSRGLRWAQESDMLSSVPSIPWQKEPPGRLVFLPEPLARPFIDALSRDSGEPYAFAAEVLMLTGMRAGELLKLEPRDIEVDIIRLSFTKTGKPRSIPLPPGYGPRILAWLPHRPSYRSLLNAVSRAGASIGIPELTPHALRHTAATRLIARGIPSLTVAELLGHSSLATTRQYAHHEVETLRQAVASLMLPSRGAKEAEDDRVEAKSLRNKEDCSPEEPAGQVEDICSPLRSHSATRPNGS